MGGRREGSFQPREDVESPLYLVERKDDVDVYRIVSYYAAFPSLCFVLERFHFIFFSFFFFKRSTWDGKKVSSRRPSSEAYATCRPHDVTNAVNCRRESPR